jgi:uncharacterized protein YraI
MRFRVLIFLTLMLMTGLFTGITAAQADISGETLATIKMRIGPNPTDLIMTTLPYRTQVTIEFRNFIGNWLLVRTDDDTRGWVASRYIAWDEEIELATIPVSGEVFGENPPAEAPETTAPAADETVPVADGEPGRALSRLNVRAGADLTAPVIDKLEYRTELIIEARNNIGNWLLVSAIDGTVRGWVASRYIGWDEEVELTTFPVSGENLDGFVPPAETPVPGSSTASDPAVPVGADGRLPDGTVPGKALVNNLFVRTGPAATFGDIGQLALNASVIIEARNQIGDWLLVHALDGSVRGWVASRFISWNEDIELATFPVSGEEVSGS